MNFTRDQIELMCKLRDELTTLMLTQRVVLDDPVEIARDAIDAILSQPAKARTIYLQLQMYQTVEGKQTFTAHRDTGDGVDGMVPIAIETAPVSTMRAVIDYMRALP